MPSQDLRDLTTSFQYSWDNTATFLDAAPFTGTDTGGNHAARNRFARGERYISGTEPQPGRRDHAAGAFIHGYVPADLLSGIIRRDAWWSVPAAIRDGILQGRESGRPIADFPPRHAKLGLTPQDVAFFTDMLTRIEREVHGAD